MSTALLLHQSERYEDGRIAPHSLSKLSIKVPVHPMFETWRRRPRMARLYETSVQRCVQ